jgi:hypothetical protein
MKREHLAPFSIVAIYFISVLVNYLLIFEPSIRLVQHPPRLRIAPVNFSEKLHRPSIENKENSNGRYGV